MPRRGLPQPWRQTCLHQEGSLSAATTEQSQINTSLFSLSGWHANKKENCLTGRHLRTLQKQTKVIGMAR